MKNEEKPNKETLQEWKENQKYWIWGMFYYNKADKRILPPKRNENMGFTLNFANPKSIASFLLMMAFFGFIITMISRNSN